MLRLYKIYERCLRNSPIITSSIQTGFLMATGDVLAQTTVDGTPLNKIDLVRSIRFGGVGLTYVGPTLTIWFRYLARTLGEKASLKLALQKSAATQLIFAPIYLGPLITILYLVQTGSIETSIQETKRIYVDVLLTSYTFWPLVNVVNFLLVPTRYQILSSQVVWIFWNTYLSWKSQTKQAKGLETDPKVKK